MTLYFKIVLVEIGLIFLALILKYGAIFIKIKTSTKLFIQNLFEYFISQFLRNITKVFYFYCKSEYHANVYKNYFLIIYYGACHAFCV